MMKRTKIEKELEKQRHKKWVKNNKGEWIKCRIYLGIAIAIVFAYAMFITAYMQTFPLHIKIMFLLSWIGLASIMTKVLKWLGVI